VSLNRVRALGGTKRPELDTERRRKAIEDELHRLEGSAMHSAQIQFEAAKQWRSLNLLLGAASATQQPAGDVSAGGCG
jgi:hypothetical protein